MSIFTRLAERARAGGATAVRARGAEGWRFWGWAELEAEVALRAFNLPIAPGEACPAGDLVEQLAVLARGGWPVPGRAPGGGKARPPPGWLLGSSRELRDGDPVGAGVRFGELEALGLALAPRLAGPLVLAGAHAFGAFCAVLCTPGCTLVLDEVTPAEARANTWICAPERLRALSPRPSRLGPLARSLGRVEAWAGPGLRLVFSDAPELAPALQARGLALHPWPESPCASWI